MPLAIFVRGIFFSVVSKLTCVAKADYKGLKPKKIFYDFILGLKPKAIHNVHVN